MLVQAIPYPAGGGGPGAHDYWRVFFTNNNGHGGNMALAEVEMRASAGGADECSGGTASVSSAAFGSAAALFDNSSAYPGSICVFGGATNQWVQYEFASAVEIVEIALTPINSPGSDPISLTPKDGKLQHSDNGTDWTDVFSFSWDSPVYDSTRVFPQDAFASGFSRGWRLNVTANVAGSGRCYIDEIEFRATSGGADQTAPVFSNVSGDADGRAVGSPNSVPSGCFDNSTGYSGEFDAPIIVGFIFPDPVKVEEISITNVGSVNDSPKDFTLEYLDQDGVTWSVQKSFTGVSWTTVPETKVLSAL